MRIVLVFLLFNMLTAADNSWMVQQIESDLAPFQGVGVRLRSLKKFQMDMLDTPEFVRYRIVDRKVSVHVNGNRSNWSPIVRHRYPLLLNSLKKLAALYPVPDVDFFVFIDDVPPAGPYEIPVLVFAKDKNLSTLVLMPDFEALRGYGSLDKEVEKGCSDFPWSEKKEQCFWRGATTGGQFTLEQWRSIPRSQLVLLSLALPSQIDAKFTKFVHGAERNKEMREIPALKGPQVSIHDSLNYKYLVEVDGNNCAFSRCYWALLSNSVVFKQTSNNIQWYYGALQPFVHYIPLTNDCQDLPEKMAWAQENDEEAMQIAYNATQFVQEHLQVEQIYEYMYLLLCRYAKMQNFTPMPHLRLPVAQRTGWGRDRDSDPPPSREPDWRQNLRKRAHLDPPDIF